MSLLKPLLPISTLSDNLIVYSIGSIPILAKELNLKQTLLGGQSFRWIEQNLGEFVGVLGSYIVRLQHQNDNLRYTFFTNHNHERKSLTENERRVEAAIILHNYFQLTINLSELFVRWCRSDVKFRKGLVPSGIRILAQDPLENLLAFLCSSNHHNARRTSKMIKILCDNYGKTIGTLNGITYHQFPTLDELDQVNLESRLRAWKFGYHARYIHEAVQFLKYSAGGTSFFDRLRKLSVKEARHQLTKIAGVDRSIADCILLMSLDKHNLVPIDTRIYSIVMTHYGQLIPGVNYDDVSSFLEQLWQPFSGWAQAAAFCNDSYSLTINTKSNIKPVKRSISNNDIRRAKLFKRTDDSNQHETFKIIIQSDKLCQNRTVSTEATGIVSTRPKRNIKPVQRF